MAGTRQGEFQPVIYEHVYQVTQTSIQFKAAEYFTVQGETQIS